MKKILHHQSIVIIYSAICVFLIGCSGMGVDIVNLNTREQFHIPSGKYRDVIVNVNEKDNTFKLLTRPSENKSIFKLSTYSALGEMISSTEISLNIGMYFDTRNEIAMSPNGKLLSYVDRNDHKIHIYDIESRRDFKIETEDAINITSSSRLQSPKFISNNEFVFIRDSIYSCDSIYLANLSTLKVAKIYTNRDISLLACSVNRIISCGSMNGKKSCISLIDLDNNYSISNIEIDNNRLGFSKLSFSPDGKKIVFSKFDDEMYIGIVDVFDKKIMTTKKADEGRLFSFVLFCGNNEIIYSYTSKFPPLGSDLIVFDPIKNNSNSLITIHKNGPIFMLNKDIIIYQSGW